MRRPAVALAVCLAAGLALVLSAPAAAEVVGNPPFYAPQVATADGGDAVVVWQAPAGIQAAIGTPGTPFGAPVTLAPANQGSSSLAVVMDAAGDVVVGWEASNFYNCAKDVCQQDSLGVFATLRPAGGSFGAPVRLSAVQRGVLARPQVAMNRAGDWIVTMSVAGQTVVGAGRRATPPDGFAPLPLPNLHDGALAIDEAGNTTFGGTDAANHPATIVRRADGSFGELTVLDDATLLGRGIAIAVGPQGHALAVWPGGGFLRSAARLPGGSFGAPVSSGVAAGNPPESIGIDGQGRTIMVLQPTPVYPARFELHVRRGTVGAPFGEPERLTAVDRDIGGPTRFAMASGGNAVLGWLETDRFRDPVAQAAIAGDAGPFSRPLALARGTGGSIDSPDVAIDGAGRAALAWTSVSGNVQRVLAASLSPTAVAGPTVVAQAPLVVPRIAQGLAKAPARQILRIRADGTVRPKLTCTGATCSGTLRIDVRPAPGRRLFRMGTHRFLFKAGRSQRVVVRVTRAARRAAARRSLKGTITVGTARVGGGSAIKLVAAVTIRRTRG